MGNQSTMRQKSKENIQTSNSRDGCIRLLISFLLFFIVSTGMPFADLRANARPYAAQHAPGLCRLMDRRIEAVLNAGCYHSRSA